MLRCRIRRKRTTDWPLRHPDDVTAAPIWWSEPSWLVRRQLRGLSTSGYPMEGHRAEEDFLLVLPWRWPDLCANEYNKRQDGSLLDSILSCAPKSEACNLLVLLEERIIIIHWGWGSALVVVMRGVVAVRFRSLAIDERERSTAADRSSSRRRIGRTSASVITGQHPAAAAPVASGIISVCKHNQNDYSHRHLSPRLIASGTVAAAVEAAA